MAEDRIIIQKRDRAEDDGGANKRLRLDTISTLALVEAQNIQRTSQLLAPTMLLSGHDAAVYTIDFDGTGANLASGSFDRAIFLWSVYGECQNYNVMRGHKGAVLEVRWWAQGPVVASASADKTVGLWDTNAGKRKKTLKGHTGVVNSVDMSKIGNLLVSGSDDGSIMLWDQRMRYSVHTFTNQYQVMAVRLAQDDNQVVTAGLDNDIKVWDIRADRLALTLEGHADTVTGLDVHPSRPQVLSTSMDQTIRSWDIGHYAAGSRELKVFQGLKHGSEKNLLRCAWSKDGSMVTGGSADQAVHVWDEQSAQELYYLSGHQGSVNQVIFHPTESIIASCGSDKTIYLGEL